MTQLRDELSTILINRTLDYSSYESRMLRRVGNCSVSHPVHVALGACDKLFIVFFSFW